MKNQHDKFIKRCYELAISAGKKGYDTFGAVLVSDNKIIKEAKMIIRNAQSKDCFSISKICKNDLIQLTNKDEIFKNYEIYKSCMYMPTEEKFCNLIEKYLNEKSIKIFCCKDENKTNGMIVVSFIEDNKIEVFGIAVDTLHQHKGIGSFMINNLIEKFNLKYILTETDNDAVGFYRKNNFAITQFEKIYNNTKVIRYKCELIK